MSKTEDAARNVMGDYDHDAKGLKKRKFGTIRFQSGENLISDALAAILGLILNFI